MYLWYSRAVNITYTNYIIESQNSTRKLISLVIQFWQHNILWLYWSQQRAVLRLKVRSWAVMANTFSSWELRTWVMDSVCYILWSPTWISWRQLSRAGVPNFQNLMPNDLRWNRCNNIRNKVHNKCNAFEPSPNPQPPPLGLWKSCLPRNQSLVPKRLRTTVLEHCTETRLWLGLKAPWWISHASRGLRRGSTHDVSLPFWA